MDCKDLKQTSNGFGSELSNVYPEDPFFYQKNIHLGCQSPTKKFTKTQLPAFISSEYIFAYQISKTSLYILYGHLTENNSVLKIKAFEKYFPRDVTTVYDFSTKLKYDIYTTLVSKINGSNNHPEENCQVSSFGDFVTYNNNSKQDLEKAILSLKAFLISFSLTLLQ